ncbi:hypothetical protein TKK_0002965 [Trichogramma kaykai]
MLCCSQFYVSALKDSNPPLFVGDAQLQMMPELSILGLKLTPTLGWDPQVSRVCSSVRYTRIVYGTIPYRAHVTPYHLALGWLSEQRQRDINTIILEINIITREPFANETDPPSMRNTLSDTIRYIPKFDGKPEKLPLFCEAVTDAIGLHPLMHKEIIRALESKLVGEAEQYVGLLISYNKVETLLDDLKDRFGNRGVAESLVLQLGRTVQKPDESARDCGSKVQMLYNRALITYRMAPDIDAIERDAALIALSCDILRCFLHGLREPTQTHVRLELPKDLGDAIRKAVDIERENSIRAATGSNISALGLLNIPIAAANISNTAQAMPINVMASTTVAPAATSNCAGTQNSNHSSQNTAMQNQPAGKSNISCQYCSKAGHVAGDLPYATQTPGVLHFL